MMQHRKQWPLRVMARVLRVSVSGYYGWRHRTPSARAQRRAMIDGEVVRIFEASHSVYGSRKITQSLDGTPHQSCRSTVLQSMKRLGLQAFSQRKKRVRTTYADQSRSCAPNTLDRNFSPRKPDLAWAADITYVRTKTGWAYVSVILDLFSRKVIGWHVDQSLETSLVERALDKALATRSPNDGMIHHSDRGIQYTSNRYREILEKRKIVCSMSRTGECYDNAVAERFFASLKCEWTNRHSYRNLEELNTSLFWYIEIFYNRKRIHQTLGYTSPEAYEASFASQEVA
jgi:putative transposase